MINEIKRILIVFIFFMGAAHAATANKVDATKALKSALDSWVFGDSLAIFKEKHPDIEFLDLKDILRENILLRYEIVGTRQQSCEYDNKNYNHQGFEFSTIMSFSGRNGKEIKQRHIYSVCNRGGWVVFGEK